jgi:hypothetical protein
MSRRNDVNPFIETVSFVGGVALPIVGGIILLSLWFNASRRLSGEGAKPEAISVRGVLGKDTFAAVHMVGGQTFDRVRLIGFISSQDMKTRLPYELNGMVILEDEQRQRFIVRARDIKMIVVAPETK